jgi:hypothetical protein
VVALAWEREAEIGDQIAESFRKQGLGVKVRHLEVDTEGMKIL